jgi:hypothetical protein
MAGGDGCVEAECRAGVFYKDACCTEGEAGSQGGQVGTAAMSADGDGLTDPTTSTTLLHTSESTPLQHTGIDPSVRPRRFAEVAKECLVCQLRVEVGQEIYPVRIDTLDPTHMRQYPAANKDSAPASTDPGAHEVTAPTSRFGEATAVYHKKRWTWAHFRCAAALCGTVPVRPVCPYFYRRHSCAYGDECFFSHPPVNLALGSGATTGGQAPGRKKRKNVGKVGVFRRFLIDVFGIDRLRQGAGIIDVAGGKGELAFELINLNGVPACVLDPRVVTVVDFANKLRSGLYTRNPLFRRYIDSTIHDAAAAAPAIPQHLKIFLTHRTVAWVGTVKQGEVVADPSLEDSDAVVTQTKSQSFFEEAVEEASGKVLVGETSKVQVYKHGTRKMDMAVLAAAETQLACSLPAVPIADHRHARNRLLQASVLVGLHPDGAAEPMIDFALQTNKPFACVPCCTCSRDFPTRRLRGKAVRSYLDLCDYLQAKSPRIQRTVLDMDGRNIVLYVLPDI